MGRGILDPSRIPADGVNSCRALVPGLGQGIGEHGFWRSVALWLQHRDSFCAAFTSHHWARYGQRQTLRRLV
jgi:hypothetical protein